MISKATIIGKVVHKAARQSKTGSKFTTLKVITTRGYIDAQGQQQEDVSSHFAHAFSKLSDFVNERIKENDLVYIEGCLQNKEVKGGERAGQYISSIHITDIRILPNKITEMESDSVGNQK